MDEKPDKDNNKDIIPDDFVESMVSEVTTYFRQIIDDILADTHTIKNPEASFSPYFERTEHDKGRSWIEQRQSLVHRLNLDLRYLRTESISDFSRVVDDNPIVYNRAMKVRKKIKELAHEVGIDPDDLISYVRDRRSRLDVEKKFETRPIVRAFSRIGRPADPQGTLNRLLEKYRAAAGEFATASDAEKRLKLAYTLDNAFAGLKQRGYDTETLPHRDLVAEARTLKRSRSRRNAQAYGQQLI